MPAWDDLAEFLDPDDFGVLAVIAYQDGTKSDPIPVLFDEPATGLVFERRQPMARPAKLGSYEADAENPSMVGTESSLARVQRRDGVTLTDSAGKRLGTFGVLTGAQPDGNGMAKVVLTREP